MSVIFEHQFDAETVEELEMLRTIRLGLARKQLDDITATADQLDASGIASNSADDVFLANLRKELTGKVKMLTERSQQKGVFFADEVQMYLSLVEGSQPA